MTSILADKDHELRLSNNNVQILQEQMLEQQQATNARLEAIEASMHSTNRHAEHARLNADATLRRIVDLDVGVSWWKEQAAAAEARGQLGSRMQAVIVDDDAVTSFCRSVAYVSRLTVAEASLEDGIVIDRLHAVQALARAVSLSATEGSSDAAARTIDAANLWQVKRQFTGQTNVAVRSKIEKYAMPYHLIDLQRMQMNLVPVTAHYTSEYMHHRAWGGSAQHVQLLWFERLLTMPARTVWTSRAADVKHELPTQSEHERLLQSTQSAAARSDNAAGLDKAAMAAFCASVVLSVANPMLLDGTVLDGTVPYHAEQAVGCICRSVALAREQELMIKDMEQTAHALEEGTPFMSISLSERTMTSHDARSNVCEAQIWAPATRAGYPIDAQHDVIWSTTADATAATAMAHASLALEMFSAAVCDAALEVALEDSAFLAARLRRDEACDMLCASVMGTSAMLNHGRQAEHPFWGKGSSTSLRLQQIFASSQIEHNHAHTAECESSTVEHPIVDPAVPDKIVSASWGGGGAQGLAVALQEALGGATVVEHPSLLVIAIAKLFDKLDRGGTGIIHAQIVVAELQALGFTISEQDSVSLIQKGNPGGDGLVDCDQFVKSVELILFEAFRNTNLQAAAAGSAAPSAAAASSDNQLHHALLRAVGNDVSDDAKIDRVSEALFDRMDTEAEGTVDSKSD